MDEELENEIKKSLLKDGLDEDLVDHLLVKS